jgi:hypothetical protein
MAEHFTPHVLGKALYPSTPICALYSPRTDECTDRRFGCSCCNRDTYGPNIAFFLTLIRIDYIPHNFHFGSLTFQGQRILLVCAPDTSKFYSLPSKHLQ